MTWRIETEHGDLHWDGGLLGDDALVASVTAEVGAELPLDAVGGGAVITFIGRVDDEQAAWFTALATLEKNGVSPIAWSSP